MATLCQQPAIQEDFAEERAEVESVIASSLRPNSNMAQLLRYVCEKRFTGHSDEIKEYSIAVEALRRPPSFDPSKDSIVRVEAHRLRSRLDSFYQRDGAGHAFRIMIPAGTYVPVFQFQSSALAIDTGAEPLLAKTPTESTSSIPAPSPGLRARLSQAAGMHLKRNLWSVGSVLVLIVAALLTHARHTRSALAAQASAAALDLPPAGAPEPASVRILAGISSPTFVDALGTSWSGDKYFSGGSAESISPRAIAFAQDPSIFLHRRRGAFSYTIPLNPGTYELRLYFSDAFFGENNPDGGGEASRVFDVRANGRLLLRNFDVVSDAGGSNTADVKVFRSIQPDASGKLRIDFLPKRDVAFVNAVEIVPTPQDRTTPLRMVMAKSGYGDPTGNWWEPDRFYRGGVSFSKPANATKTGTAIPRSERFGNFVYAIPVAANETYKATLTFKEVDTTHLLGDTPGERIDIFSVFVNGRPLIDRLELGLNQGHSQMIQRTFRGLQPNAQDKLIFSFVPIRNYALVNSIEVVEDE